jgi:hypothetical protein
MNQTDTPILHESNKSVKDIKNMFENQRKRAQTTTSSKDAQQDGPMLSSRHRRADSEWIKNKPEQIQPSSPQNQQPGTPKKSSPQYPQSAKKADTEEESVRNQIKKFEEITKKNVEKQSVIKKLEEKITKREEDSDKRLTVNVKAFKAEE